MITSCYMQWPEIISNNALEKDLTHRAILITIISTRCILGTDTYVFPLLFCRETFVSTNEAEFRITLAACPSFSHP